MTARTILIVEDDATNRLSLLSALRMRGFRTEAAATVTEARDWANKLGGQIDVMVLDMRLEDPDYDLTGADLGLEVRRAYPKWSPEFLIFSGYRQLDYYQAALQLGVAAYLVKGTVEQEDIIRHIRSLALRRSLSIEREEIAEKIGLIAQRSHTPPTAIINFCRQLLAPKMEACLGLPFMLLLSDKQGTQNCGSDTNLPSGYDAAYATIQALAHGAVNNHSTPFVFNLQHLGGQYAEQTLNIYQKLDGAAFLPLCHHHDLQLSLGILKPDKTRHLLFDEPEKAATSIGNYASSTIAELLFLTLTRRQELKSSKQLAVLTQTARLCLYIGQEQLAILSEAEGWQKKQSPQNESFQKLKALAVDLRTTGEQLSTLGDEAGAAIAGHRAEAGPVDVAAVVRQAWEEIQEQFPTEEMTLEENGSPFEIAIERDDLLLAVLHVLQWMMQRADKVPPDTNAKIAIEYIASADGVEISFLDSSRRLSSPLRQRLFDPFTQVTAAPPLMEGAKRPGRHLPLYLAKVLVEIKHNGLLEDQTDALEGGCGHRLVMSFPSAKGRSSSSKAVVGA